MTQRFVLKCCALTALLLLSASCGSSGGGVGDFKTVQVGATAGTSSLDSDTVSGNSCPTTTGTIVDDNVTFTITSTVYPNQSGTPSPVEVDSYTVSFAPANALSPALPTLNGSITGTTVTAGGNTTISVGVAPASLKLLLVNGSSNPPITAILGCSNTIYDYYVTVTFDVLEINTGTRHPVTARMNVHFADWAG